MLVVFYSQSSHLYAALRIKDILVSYSKILFRFGAKKNGEMRLECLSDWLLCYSSVAAIFFKTVLVALVVHLLSKYSKYRNQHLQSLTMTSRSLMSFRRLDRECKLKPHPRSGHRIVVYNNNIYAIGGYNKNFQEVSNTEATSYPLFREVSKRFRQTS